MLVDVEILRAFAVETSSTSEVIDANDLAGVLVAAFANVAGSSSAWAAQGVDFFVAARTAELARGFDTLAAAASGTAGSYEVTDTEFADGVGRVFP